MHHEDHSRLLSEIAADVIQDWRQLSYGAVSSVAAMRELRNLDDRRGDHSGRAVVRDFLGHAGPWNGPVAKRVKAELASMLRSTSP